MAKRPRILTADIAIHKLDGDGYFLELDDPQEHDNKEGNYITKTNLSIPV